MTLQRATVAEAEFRLMKKKDDEISLLWDGILDILLERIHYKSISLTELAHLTDELVILLRAIKGQTGVWGSVVDVVLQLLKNDVTIRDLRANLHYNESTIYRALTRLELAGFAVQRNDDFGIRRWTVNRNTCPVLYRASRQA